MAEKTYQDVYNGMPRFVLPRDEREFKARYWTTQDAAKAWGCHYTTAKRLIDRHHVEEIAVWLERKYGASPRYVIAAGTAKPSSAPPGNPKFRDPDQQKELAERRWGDKRSEADVIAATVRDMDTLAKCRERIQVRSKMGTAEDQVADRTPMAVDFNGLLAHVEEAERRLVPDLEAQLNASAQE